MINFKTHTTGRYFKRAAIVGISVFLAFGTLTDPSSSKSRLWHSLLFLLPFLRPGAKEACVPMPDGSAKVMPDGSAKVRAHAGRISEAVFLFVSAGRICRHALCNISGHPTLPVHILLFRVHCFVSTVQRLGVDTSYCRRHYTSLHSFYKIQT